jgi:hypothetical protein
MFNSTSKSGCPDLLSSNCVAWNGPNIPALGIKYGQSLSESVNHIANKVCNINKELDLSDLSLECIIDLCNTCPQEKSLVNILKLLLDNQCSLKELIDNALGQTEEEDKLNINLRCLKKYDEFDNEIPQDLNQSLQSIINEVCSNKNDIALLYQKTNDLQNQIDNLDLNPQTNETIVSTCLATARPVSQSLVVTTNELCELRSETGETLDIQAALSRQSPNLNSILGSVEGWILSPQNLSNSLNNLWIAYSNLLTRVTHMENNCCKPTCDSIKLGFIVNFEGTTLTMSFTNGAGTFIPSGFTDCGSNVTITNGTSTINVPITIEQGITTEPIDASLFKIGDDLTFTLSANLCAEGLNCSKCYVKTVKYNAGGCCVITNEGSGNAMLTYRIPVTQSI